MQRKPALKTSIDEMQLKILRLTRDATAAGVITWEISELDNDWYHAKSGPIKSYIRFKWPSYNGEGGSDRDCVDLGHVGRFMIGTPGWQVALGILAAGHENWHDHVARLREQYQREIDCLQKALHEKRNRRAKRSKYVLWTLEPTLREPAIAALNKRLRRERDGDVC